MPTFSEDDFIDFCVGEAVVRAGVEFEREATEKAHDEQEAKERHSPKSHKAWAEQNGFG